MCSAAHFPIMRGAINKTADRRIQENIAHLDGGRQFSTASGGDFQAPRSYDTGAGHRLQNVSLSANCNCRELVAVGPTKTPAVESGVCGTATGTPPFETGA